MSVFCENYAMWSLYVAVCGAALVTGALFLCGTLDVAHFLRIWYIVAKFKLFKKKACILETAKVDCWCLLSDIDFLYHMNNARYFRELDFARADFYQRTGLFANIQAAGGSAVETASTIRYRRSLKPFTRFTITSKIVYWDDKSIFMEHEFIGPGGFIHAVAVCRQRVIDTSPAAIIEHLIKLNCTGGCHPPPDKMPHELELWVQSNELSSARLRNPGAQASPPKLWGSDAPFHKAKE